jgi:hypothetical protein
MLAVRGELSTADSALLSQHVSGCSLCRRSYSDLLAIHAGLISTSPSDTDEELIEALRRSTRKAVLDAIEESEAEPAEQGIPVAESSPTKSWVPVGIAWTTLSMVLTIGGFWLGTQYSEKTPVLVKVPSAAPPVISVTSARGEATPDATAQHQVQQLQAKLDFKNRELNQLQGDESRLHQQLAEGMKELTLTRALLNAKTQQLTQLQDARSQDSAEQVALRIQVQSLTDKLNSQTQSIARERELLARDRDIRDIIGARNLHIIDVYDTDTRGHTKRPFARAFYTEGSSLVFYAYDLPVDPNRTSLAYVAWGQANGTRSSIKNLGILVNDDKGQRRWTLSFSDPKVLAEIDSVFITLEPKPDAGSPSGKRMLTAYLNDTANHP